MEDMVDVSKLETLLDRLVKAADTPTVRKGGIENSGTIGSDGPQGGGQGSMADAGALDSMMIAKMAEAGIPLSTITAFNAFMSKNEDDEDDDEDDEDDDEEIGKGGNPAPDLSKSFRDALGEQLGASQEMVDVSPYLDGLTAAVGDRIDVLTKSVMSTQKSQGGVNKALAAAISQMGKLAKSQAVVIDKMAAKLGVLERAPVAPPRSVTGTGTPLVKSGMGGEEQLTKSEVCSVLSYMNLEKGMREIGGRRTTDLVVNLEAGSIYDEETHGAVTGFLKSLPTNERNLAKSYH